MKESKFMKCINLLLSLAIIALPCQGYCLPEGESVVSGSATFDRSEANVLNVNVCTDQLIANYDSFSIAGMETVHFIQPSASSIALNRVVGGEPSSILGTLTANGRIFLINPNGVLFGQGCRIDTAGMVASTLNLSDSDFLAGRYTFVGAGGSVVNQGYISSPGGYVALLGSTVANSGIIEANLGSVVLASGKAMTLGLDPAGMISVVIDEAALNQPGTKGSAVFNTGKIFADGGKVVLTAKTLGGVFDKAVNNEGIIEAKSFVGNKGEVYLLSEGENEFTSNTGTIDVSVKDPLAEGGFIEISGDEVNIDGIIDASSAFGKAGELLIDPGDITIVDKSPSDGLSGSTVGEAWLEAQNYSITIQADDDVIFDLTSDNLLNLSKFNDETFTVKAGNDILLNDDAIQTNGGNIKLYSNYGTHKTGSGEINLGTGSGLTTKGGDVLLEGAKVMVSAPIKTSGGDVTVRSTNGNVVHTAKGDVETSGGDFYGESAADYILRNDASIDTGNGDLEINAEQNIVLGSNSSDLTGTFNWKYIKDERSYRFLEFGYYYDNGSGLVYVPLSEGYDIGKDHSSPTSGSGVLGDDVSSFNLYAIFKPSCGSNLTWYEDQALNADGKDHLSTSGIRNGWEDMYNLGDRDYDDAVIDVTKNFSVYAPGAFLSSHKLVSLEAEHGSITQSGGKITVGNSCSDPLDPPVVVSSHPGKKNWSNDNTVDVSWKIDESSSNSGEFIAKAGNKFIMQNAAEINTNDGDATITAENNVALTLIDAGFGAVAVSSKHGSIIDNDKGKVAGSGAYPLQNDYDILARNIKLSAPHGSVGGSGAGEEIDKGYSYQNKGYGFSYRWTTSNSSLPDVISDTFAANLDSNGDWIFSTVSDPLADSASWYFHIASVKNSSKSSTVHYGPFYIDTTAPIILAGVPTGTKGNLDWWLSDVTVPFSATDNLSGFSPCGSLSTNLGSETTIGEGTDLFVTSDGVYDRAGNFAPVIKVGTFKVDKTAPVITAGAAQGTMGGADWWLSDVTVPFSATDNLSGVAPSGALIADLASKTTSGEGEKLFVTSDGVFDIAGNFAKGIPAGPFHVVKVSTEALFSAANAKKFRAFYEILKNFRVNSLEPVTPTTLFGYHPLTPMDMSAFDGINVDSNSYDFISDKISMKKSLAPYLSL
ncbi:MAG: filamentous hemagglutinin N-terminal domain-containing protein [Candidatus Omnitrophica bacterium]|nr:filamentous hemagglutinin N-terminal domain-containing protein [Candidatus Omnitrophota bacterium]